MTLETGLARTTKRMTRNMITLGIAALVAAPLGWFAPFGFVIAPVLAGLGITSIARAIALGRRRAPGATERL